MVDPSFPSKTRGWVLGLVSQIPFAAKIAQAAKSCRLNVHNFDRASVLIEYAKQHPPVVVILDWDGCQAEAFKVLKEFAACADLKNVPTVGYVSYPNEVLKQEARLAGCHRVYSKSEFIRALEDLLVRYLS